jgi:hypothetical protein
MHACAVSAAHEVDACVSCKRSRFSAVVGHNPCHGWEQFVGQSVQLVKVQRIMQVQLTPQLCFSLLLSG